VHEVFNRHFYCCGCVQIVYKMCDLGFAKDQSQAVACQTKLGTLFYVVCCCHSLSYQLVFTKLVISAVHSVMLNLANKFSQCTFIVAEHYDLFSGLVKGDGVDRMMSYRTDHTEPTEKLLQEKLNATMKLIYMLPIMPYATNRQFKSRRPLLICPEQPTPSLQNCHAHSLKTLANSRRI